MDSLTFDDIELSFELTDEQGGSGTAPVVFVHASPFVSWYGPLIDHLTSATTMRYRRHLRRSGGDRYRPLTVAEDATTCARLMDHIGWRQAHVVGHSYGALVALQLAMDAPDRVGSVALLEPAARGVSSAEHVLAALRPIFAAYQAGDTEAAVDGFLRHVCGDDYRAALDRVLPDAFAEALAEADLFFQAEMAAVGDFSFGLDDAERIAAPVLNVSGAESVERFRETSDLVESWFPQAERLTVPGAGHLLMVQNPTYLARGLGDFFARHPIGDARKEQSGSASTSGARR
jgi:pimeloyl-ACP methyl ester carboxylesterase